MLKMTKAIALAVSVTFVGLAAPAEAQVFYMNKNTNYVQADKAMRAGDLDKASRLFKRAIKGSLHGEQLLAAYNNLCAVDLARGALKSAEKACSGAIAENRLYWRAYVNRGHVRSAMGQQDLALKDLQKALKLKPNSKLAQRVLARVQESHRLYAEAK